MSYVTSNFDSLIIVPQRTLLFVYMTRLYIQRRLLVLVFEGRNLICYF